MKQGRRSCAEKANRSCVCVWVSGWGHSTVTRTHTSTQKTRKTNKRKRKKEKKNTDTNRNRRTTGRSKAADSTPALPFSLLPPAAAAAAGGLVGQKEKTWRAPRCRTTSAVITPDEGGAAPPTNNSSSYKTTAKALLPLVLPSPVQGAVLRMRWFWLMFPPYNPRRLLLSFLILHRTSRYGCVCIKKKNQAKLFYVMMKERGGSGRRGDEYSSCHVIALAPLAVAIVVISSPFLSFRVFPTSCC